MTLNIDATADLIMSAKNSDAFDREACVKILRDAQESEESDTSCSHPFPQMGCPDCGAWLQQPKPESWRTSHLRLRREHIKGDWWRVFIAGSPNITVLAGLSHIESNDLMMHWNGALKETIERSHAAQPQPSKKYPFGTSTEVQKSWWKSQPSDQPPAKTTDDKQGFRIAKRIADECVGPTTFNVPHAEGIINAELAAEREISKEWFDRWGDMNTDLATERQRNFDAEKELRDKARARIEELRSALSAALAAIEKHNKLGWNKESGMRIEVDLSALKESRK